MRTKLLTATLLTLAVALSSCGGGGGGGSTGGSASGGGSTSKSLTYEVTPSTSKATTTDTSTTPVFNQGVPVLICDNGNTVYTGNVQGDGVKVVFTGNNFNSCVLALTAGDGSIIETTDEAVSLTGNSGTVQVDEDLDVVSASGVQKQQVADQDGDHIADNLEGHKCKDKHLEKVSTTYDRVVIFVMEADDLSGTGVASLTSLLEGNYNTIVNGLQQAGDTGNTKIVVLWDGGKYNGDSGKSDIAILTPTPNADIYKVEDDLDEIIAGHGSVANYSQDGIQYWFAKSDNLSVHLPELLWKIKEMYPAKKYDLILSSHGDGWTSIPLPPVKAVLWEKYTDSSGRSGSLWLGTKQFADYLKELKEKGMHFELIGFDECLDGEFTTLRMVAPYTDYIVASETTEPGYGWGSLDSQQGFYFNLPSYLKQNLDGWTLAKKIVDDYITYYSNNPTDAFSNPNQNSLRYVSLTAVKSDAVLQLADKFEAFAKALDNTIVNSKDQYESEIDSRYNNNTLSTSYFVPLFADPNVVNLNETDSTFQSLIAPIKTDYFYLYEPAEFVSSGDDTVIGSNTIGFDLLWLVASTGATARAVELGDSVSYPFYSQNPTFDSNLPTAALDFVNTYSQLKNNGDIYTKALRIDGSTVQEWNMSGIGIVYPRTALAFAPPTMVQACSIDYYDNAVQNLLPNWKNFVDNAISYEYEALQSYADELQNVVDCSVGSMEINQQ